MPAPESRPHCGLPSARIRAAPSGKRSDWIERERRRARRHSGSLRVSTREVTTGSRPLISGCGSLFGVRRRFAPDPAVVVLGALVLVSTVGRFAVARGVAAPWIAPDEQLYGLLGRSLVAGEGLRILDAPVPYYSLVYPLVVGLPFVWSGLQSAVTQVQALQALLMSATAIPVYLWARPVANRRWALVAAALTVLIPGMTYSSLLMSEALYYPVATLAVWALATCLREPTLARQGVLAAAIALALATRLQAVGFVLVLPVALAVLALSERSLAPFRRLAPLLGGLGVLAVAWVGSRIVLGSADEVVGAYTTLTRAGQYTLGDVLQSLAWQTGALALFTIVVPLVALGVLTWGTIRGREGDAGVRALAATGAAYLTVTVLEVSAFASRFVEHVTERQLLSVVPPTFVALAVWLHRGAPRPQPFTSLMAVGVAATALLLPLGRVTAKAVYADSPSMISLERISAHLSRATFEMGYAVTIGAVILLTVVLPRRAVPALALLVAGALAAGSVIASLETRDGSRTERDRSFAGAPPSWIDESGGRDVTLVLTGARFWPSAWQALFWNESIRRVVRLPGVESPGILAEVVAAPRVDGRLVTSSGTSVAGEYVVAPSTVSVVGDRIATIAPSFEQPGMTLWRATGPVTMSDRVRGLRPNGDLHGGEHARIRVFGCEPGRLELTVLGKEGRPTRVLIGGKVIARRSVAPGEVWRPTIPSPASADGSSVCDFRLESDGLIGTTRVEYVRR